MIQYTFMDIYNNFLHCSAIVLLLCFTLFLKALKSNKKNLPPGPTGLPILGSLLAIGKRPYETLAEIAKTHGPLMTVKFGMVKVVIVSSAEMAKQVLRKNDVAFIGRPTPESASAGKYYHMSMVWSSGKSSHWKKVRKISNTQLFTTQRLDALREIRHRMTRELIQRVGEACEAREPIRVRRLAFATSLNLLSNTIYSDDVKSDGIGELREVLGNLLEISLKANIADFLPFLKPFDPQGIKRDIRVCHEKVHKIFADIIEKRIRHRAENKSVNRRRGDFLDVLLDHSEEHGAEELSILNIRILLMDLFVAGTHTTTVTTEWAMAELLHNPQILAKAKKELANNVPQNKTLVEEQDIPHLPYLESIIKETMRLHPSAPLLLPHLTEEEVEICGYTIPQNTQVFVNVWSIMRDQVSWVDPTRFYPERFMDSDIDIRGKDCTFIPFGAGRRICPGSNLAMRMLSLMLANLVRSFDWELPEGMNPDEIDMTGGFGIALQKHEPLVAVPVHPVCKW